MHLPIRSPKSLLPACSQEAIKPGARNIHMYLPDGAYGTPPLPIFPYPLRLVSLPLPESPFDSVSVPVPSLPVFSFAPSPRLVMRSLFGVLCAFPFSAALGDLLLLAPRAFLSASAGFVWLKSFHLRHPSKSMSACMQPHSITLRVSHSKFTGYQNVSMLST